MSLTSRLKRDRDVVRDCSGHTVMNNYFTEMCSGSRTQAYHQPLRSEEGTTRGFKGHLLESQGHNLAFTVSCAPYSLNSESKLGIRQFKYSSPQGARTVWRFHPRGVGVAHRKVDPPLPPPLRCDFAFFATVLHSTVLRSCARCDLASVKSFSARPHYK